MKRFFYFIFLLTLFSAVTAQPQTQPTPRENIAALKVAFVNKQLALTTEESQRFWPMYRQYMQELRTTRQEKKGDVLTLEESVLNVRKKYGAEFKKILGTDERVNKALTVERDFMNVVKKELQQRRMKGGRQKEPI